MISKSLIEKAKSGDAEAMNDLAMLYFKKSVEDLVSVEVSNSTQFDDWLRNSIEHNNEEACNSILRWAQKRVDNEDFEVCLTLIEYLAKKGNAASQLILGYCYDTGYCGSIIDYNKAIYWYKQASNNGEEIAKERLIEMGMFYSLP